MLLALPCVLSAGAVWTEARDLLARLFSPAETCELGEEVVGGDRKSTRLNSSH